MNGLLIDSVQNVGLSSTLEGYVLQRYWMFEITVRSWYPEEAFIAHLGKFNVYSTQ